MKFPTPRGHALIGSRLYLPAEHLDDAATRTAMGIEADHEFKTKPGLGAELLTDALDAGVRVDWCTADAVYGRDWTLRQTCQKRGIGYSLGVPCSFRIRLAAGTTIRADATLKILTARAWQVASCGPGSKGDRRYAFAWLATASPRHFLLIRRSLTKSADLAYFARTHSRDVGRAGYRDRATLDHRRRPRIRQGPVRLRPVPAPPVHPDHAAHRAGHGRPRGLRRDRRRQPNPPQPPRTSTTPTQPPPADLALIPFTVVEIKRLFNLATT
jgi:hypothetical protein